MTKTFCDRCRAEITPGNISNITIEIPLNIYTIGRPSETKYELCSKCAADVEQFIEEKNCQKRRKTEHERTDI